MHSAVTEAQHNVARCSQLADELEMLTQVMMRSCHEVMPACPSVSASSPPLSLLPPHSRRGWWTLIPWLVRAAPPPPPPRSDFFVGGLVFAHDTIGTPTDDGTTPDTRRWSVARGVPTTT